MIAVAIGGWLGGWWLNEDATNRRTGIANDSLARQQALVDEVTDKAADIADLDTEIAREPEGSDLADRLGAQRAAIIDQFCQSYGSLTGRLTYPASVDALAAQECT